MSDAQPGAQDRTDAPELTPPQTGKLQEIGGFELLGKIGQGGMGAVFKARQKSLDRIVAVKILRPSAGKNALFIERFQREARASARFNHPHIVQGIDVGKDPVSGLWYFAMEYVDGPSLKQVLAEQKVLPEERALRLVREIAQALGCIAANGMVHRDVKPDNILLTKRGEAKLADLGLAKQANDDASVTQSGTSVGTPHYMAPEQVRGQTHEIDIRTDIYALGGTLFHLVTGRAPYSGESSAVIMSKHLTEPPPQARALNPQVSEGCSRLIEWMMQKHKEQRIQTPAELLKQLDGVLRQEPVSAPHEPLKPLSTTPRKHGPRLRLALKAGLAAALALASGMFFVFSAKRTQEPSRRDHQAMLTGGTPVPPPPKAAEKTDLDNPLSSPPKTETPQELFRAAQDWEKAHPEAYEEILARYQRVAQAAKGAEPDSHLDELLDEAIAAAYARRAGAGEAAWKRLEEQINAAAAAGNYDAALAACQTLPQPLAKALEERVADRARLLHQEADAKLKAAVARIEECSANAEPAAGQKVLVEAEKIAYAPAKGTIEALRKRLQDELANEPEIKRKKALRTAEKRLSELLQRFDFALLAADDLQAAKNAAAEAGPDPALAPLEAQARALGELCAAFDELARMSQEALAKLKGQKVELETKGGKLSGTVEKIEEGTVFLKIAFGGGAEGRKQIKIAELSEEQRRIFSGSATPQTNAQYLALAVTKMAKSREDFKAAAELLAGAGDFPLVPHYAKLLEELKPKAAQAEAEAKAAAAWAELDSLARAATPKLSDGEAQQKVLLSKVTSFEAQFGATQFAATVKDKLAAIKERTAQSGANNAIQNGDFESGALDPWQPFQADREASQCEVVKGDAHGGNCAALLKVQDRGGLQQSVSAEPGGFYRFSAWMKLLKGDGALSNSRIMLSDEKYQATINSDFLQALKPDVWSLVEGTARAGGAKPTFVIFLRPSAAVEVLMDDLRLLKFASGPVPVANTVSKGPPKATGLAPVALPETLRSKGLVFWVSPNSDPAGTHRELVSNTPGEDHNASVATEEGRKSLVFQKGYLNYEGSSAAAAVTTAGSVFAWLKTEQLSQSGGILNRGERSREDFSLWLDNGRLALRFNWPMVAPRRAAGENKGNFYSKSMLPGGKWVFCGAVWDGKAVLIYINGVRDNFYLYTGHPFARFSTFSIGANPSLAVEHFAGSIASAMLFNRALTDAEIAELFANPVLKAK